MTSAQSIQTAYTLARARFAEEGVDTDSVITCLDAVPVSIHCWQGDDVRGFEDLSGGLTGGIQASGNYPGRARNANELRDDVQVALAQIPGKARFNLHATYPESDKPVERDSIQPDHFKHWVSWAKQHGLALDFNPTFFSHRLSARNLTLSHPDPDIRRFWINHGLACRVISDYFGKELGPRLS
jgi:L-rhamnose isomerase